MSDQDRTKPPEGYDVGPDSFGWYLSHAYWVPRKFRSRDEAVSACWDHYDAIERAGIRKGLEMARDAVCPRCEAIESHPLGTGEYADRHVFAGDVLGECAATPIRRALEEMNDE